MKFNLRTVLSIIVVVMLLVLAACGGNQSASTNSNSSNNTTEVKPLELKLGHMNSTEHVQHSLVKVPFSEEVEKLTEGRVKITIYPGSALAAPPASYDSVVTGLADISWGLQGYTAGKFPITSAIGLPFIDGGITPNMSKTLWELYETIPEMQEEYGDVKPLWFHVADSYQIVTKGKQVKTLEDLRGLKLRGTSAEANALIQSWGATPVSMPMPEFYEAVQKGVVDGGVIPIAAIADFNLGDVVDYVTIGNFHTAPFFTVMNKDSWNKISPEDQQKIEPLLGANLSEKAGEAFEVSLQKAYEIIEQEGIEVYELPNDELQGFKDASVNVAQDWIEDMESKGLPGQKVYDTLVELAAKNK